MQMAGANPGIHCFRGRPPKPCAALPGLRMAALFICFAALMQGAAFAVCTHPHRGVIYRHRYPLALAVALRFTGLTASTSLNAQDADGSCRQITLRCGLAMGCQVIGKASSPHDDATDYLDCRSVVKRQFRSDFRHVLS